MDQGSLPPPMAALQMMMGHWVSQVLATIAELGVADQIAKGVHDSTELARLCEAHPDALFRVLRAGATVGILQQTGARTFALTPVGDCLRSDSQFAMRVFIVAELAPGHWLPWGRLSQATRTGKSPAKEALGCEVWDYYAKNPDEGATFARGMGNLSQMVAIQSMASYDFSHFQHVVDVGGSQGALLAAVLRASGGTRGTLFDRPDVIEHGAERVRSYELGDRLKTEGGDFFVKVPEGDGYLLKSILHDWDDEHCDKILQTIHRSSKAGAKLLVFEMVLSDDPMATPIKLMDLNMLVMLNGRERTAEEYGALLSKAGFRLERVIPTQGLFSILEATRL